MQGRGRSRTSGSATYLRYPADVPWTPDKIRERRLELGLSQLELADRLGVSVRSVSSWETGDAKPRRGTLLDPVLGEPAPLVAEFPANPITEMGNAELIALLGQLVSEIARRMPERDVRSPRLAEPSANAVHYVGERGQERPDEGQGPGVIPSVG